MTPQIIAMGDACMSVVFEEAIDERVNAVCVALAADLERRQLPGVRDVVPAYHTVAVYFDPLRVRRSDVQRELERAVAGVAEHEPPIGRGLIEIGVTYGGAAGPDLASVAEFASCTEAEVIRLHTTPIYRVYMVGFLPGFAYLGKVERRIAMPRLDTPRLLVPAGSVGIAGAQTAVYPCDTPGGWRIIGRAARTLFDTTREEPSVLKAGDRVRFVAA